MSQFEIKLMRMTLQQKFQFRMCLTRRSIERRLDSAMPCSRCLASRSKLTILENSVYSDDRTVSRIQFTYFLATVFGVRCIAMAHCRFGVWWGGQILAAD